MIYVCTVHFETERWISRQTAFLRRNLDRPYRVMACVPQHRRRREFHVESTYEPTSKGSFNHAEKLNYLASIVTLEADPDDILIFLDGDAFPIRPVGDYLEEKLSHYPLVAVQRLENDGDMQPHPCFAATTVKFWKDIGGDWSPGFEWANARGEMVTDPGANLMLQLNERSEVWYPMLRSNRRNLHPLWFGLYDDMVYHHGAGYRKPISRQDLARSGTSYAHYQKTRDYAHFHRMQQSIFRRMAFNKSFYKAFL